MVCSCTETHPVLLAGDMEAVSHMLCIETEAHSHCLSCGRHTGRPMNALCRQPLQSPLLAPPSPSQKIASLECLRRPNICVNPLTPGSSPSGHGPRTQKLYAPELVLTEGGRRVRAARWRGSRTCRPRQQRRHTILAAATLCLPNRLQF